MNLKKEKQMIKERVLIFVIIVFAMLGFQACEKEGSENEANISAYNSTSSHHMGQECMNCHQAGGSGEGWFIVAGTVYDNAKTNTYPNATVKLYTGTNGSGDLVATIEVDGNGNFYTTENVNFGSGLYPVVEGSAGTKAMNSSITTGNCNSCHGNSVNKIWVE